MVVFLSQKILSKGGMLMSSSCAKKSLNILRRDFLRGQSVAFRISRPYGNRPKRRYFLIVCEGEKTEPNYFEAIANQLPKDMVRRIVVVGTGRNTIDLITEAKKEIAKRERSGAPDFYYVWLVFDRDDFPMEKFNEVINTVETLNREASPEQGRPYWNCAWSNEAFELWYILHFQELSGGALSRTQYQEMLETAIRNSTSEKNFLYKKNDNGMFSRLRSFTPEAIARSERALKRQLELHGKNWAEMNPATRVHELVRLLMAYL